MSGSHKQKEIIEIFYDKDGLEVRPEDPEYERFLNGSEEYFGSYFVDENENIVREDNPRRTKSQKEKDTIRKEQVAEEKSKRKKIRIVLAVVGTAIVLLILFIISQKTAEDINRPYIEIKSSISSEYCSGKSNSCSTVNTNRISIEVSVSINSRYTSQYTTPKISNSADDKRYSCQEVKTDKFICEVELVEGRNNLKITSTVTPQDSTLSWEHSENLTVFYSPETSSMVNIRKAIIL